MGTGRRAPPPPSDAGQAPTPPRQATDAPDIARNPAGRPARRHHPSSYQSLYPPAGSTLPLRQAATVWVRTSLVAQLALVLLDLVLRWLPWCVYRVVTRSAAGTRGHRFPRAFLLLSSPRSGSNLALTLLNGHPEVACLSEVLNPAFLWHGDVHRAPQWRQRLFPLQWSLRPRRPLVHRSHPLLVK